MVASAAAFFAGAGLTALACVAGRIRVGTRRGGPRGRAPARAQDGDLGGGQDGDLGGRQDGDAGGGPADWQTRCLRLQLSEQYVASQTKQIIDEYSCLMSMTVDEAMQRTQTLRESSTAVAGRTAATQESTHLLVDATARVEDLLRRLESSLVSVDGMADFIASVAKRTNLLALNATIEASRAGDAGRGFAVVAHEVKELATVTARSTTEISGTVDELRQQVGSVMTSLRDMGAGVESIDRAASGIAGLMSDQQDAMEGLDLQVNDIHSQLELLTMLVDNVDRRRDARVAAGGVVQLRIGDQVIDAQLLDLSVSGLGCSVLHSVELATDARMAVTLPVADARLNLEAVVCRRTPAGGRDHVGLQFLDASPSDVAAIEDYAAHLAAGDDGPQIDALALDTDPTQRRSS
jgi:methyl-accepting chemotaxis protein